MPNRDFYIDAGFLDKLITHLIEKDWKICTLDDILACQRGHGDGSRLVNFSVDDCYRDTYEIVVPIFRRHKVPVTLFVSTGIPDRTMTLARAGLETILLQRDTVESFGRRIDISNFARKRALFSDVAASCEAGGLDAYYRAFCEENEFDAGALDEQHAITWPMLHECCRDGGVEIGSHTVSHPRMSDLNSETAKAELVASKNRLQEKLGREIRHFAFPYGRPRDCDQRDFEMARRAGYLTASTTRRGVLKPQQDLFCLPRNTLNAARTSVHYVMAKVSGLTGLAAKMLNSA